MMVDEEEAKRLLTVTFLTSIAFLLFILLASLQGCTTVVHEPECKCDCEHSKFECGGSIEHQEINLP